MMSFMQLKCLIEGFLPSWLLAAGEALRTSAMKTVRKEIKVKGIDR